MTTKATITAEVVDFKCGPATARQFDGKFDRETKLWTIPVPVRYSNEPNGNSHFRQLVRDGAAFGLRVIACDIAISQTTYGSN